VIDAVVTDQPWKVASISGHRSIGPNSKKRVWNAVKLLVENSTIRAIYFGGARGVDNEALKAALYYRKGAYPRLIVVIPNTIEEQPTETRQWTTRADEVIELKQVITSEDGYLSYRKRNEYLVDHGTFLVAFFNGNFKSGTGQAIRYAEKLGKPVYKISVSAA
jgi:uncharacterized phage-like protein YoqJ